MRKVDGHFYGTGDAFAAALIGELSEHARLIDCLPQIMKRIQASIRNTLLSENDLKLGIDITPMLRRND